jgi:hypothetical protein
MPPSDTWAKNLINEPPSKTKLRMRQKRNDYKKGLSK